MNITLENIDLTNTEHLAHALSALNAYAALSPDLLSGVENIRIDFRTLDLIPMRACPPSASAPSLEEALGIYGKTTRAFLQQTLGRIDAQGSTTLEDVATDMGISLDTARAYLRNAGRTASAHKVPLPVKPKWDHEKGRNDYVRS